MKRLRLAALLLALLLTLAACAGEHPSLPYIEGECRHVWGYWYDVEAVTCLDAGKQLRYCKLCRATEEQIIDVATDIAQRNHSFSDTVTAPSESSGGYTTRVCSLCNYRVDGVDPTPALFALVAREDTVTVAPSGLDGILLSDTVTHRLAYHAPVAVHPEFARRLSVALVVADELARKSTTLFPYATLTVAADLLTAVPAGTVTTPNAFYAGAVVTLEQTLGLWLSTGGADAALVLAAFLGTTPDALASDATARAARLTALDTEITSLTAPTAFGASTLYDTGVLLCRALADGLLADILSSIASGSFVKIGGRTPAVWLASATLRISALREGDCVRFLLLAGNSIANGTEAEFFLS